MQTIAKELFYCGVLPICLAALILTPIIGHWQRKRARIADRMLNREPSCLYWFKRGDRREIGSPMYDGTGRARRER